MDGHRKWLVVWVTAGVRRRCLVLGSRFASNVLLELLRGKKYD
jgi:hypothetical protein